MLQRIGHGLTHDLEQADLVVAAERVGICHVERDDDAVVGLEAVGDRLQRGLEALLA